MQVLLVVGFNFTGYAAKQGSSQAVLWLLAIVLFYLPQAVVVIRLSRAIPLEGGVYQWVKQGVSPFAGYMAGWSYSIYIICFFGSFGSQLANGFAYAGGTSSAWMATSKPFTLAIIVGMCLLAYALNVRGLHIAKWLSGIGSLLGIFVFVIMIYLLLKAFFLHGPSGSAAFAFTLPALSILSLNVFTKMALFALSGFDQCAIFSEECRKPKNDVARSVVISAPLIALMYILGTSAVLAYIRSADVDVAAPISQLLQAGFGSAGMGRSMTAIAVLAFNGSLIAALVVVVGMVSRLPMAAGWDGLLPEWWSRLNARFGTPSKAIAVVASGLMLMGFLSLFGAGNQEAVQALSAVGFGSYCIMYMLLFGGIVLGFRSTAWRPSVAIRLGASAALSVVLVSFAFQLIPVEEVASPLRFAMRVVAGICATTGFGAYLYWVGSRRAARLAELQVS
jgi:amino acid transporter